MEKDTDSHKIKDILVGCALGVSLLVSGLSLYVALRNNKPQSAYEIAVKNGFVGTEAEWLASLKGDKGDPGESSFANLSPVFDDINTKLANIDKSEYKTPYERFSQLDINIEDVLLENKTYENYFFYSLKDNQFVLADITNYLINNKLVVANNTTSYKKGSNIPTKSVDLFKFIYKQEKVSDEYSNYLTSDYVPIGYTNDWQYTQLKGVPIEITTGLDIGSLQTRFIIKL